MHLRGILDLNGLSAVSHHTNYDHEKGTCAYSRPTPQQCRRSHVSATAIRLCTRVCRSPYSHSTVTSLSCACSWVFMHVHKILFIANEELKNAADCSVQSRRTQDELGHPSSTRVGMCVRRVCTPAPAPLVTHLPHLKNSIVQIMRNFPSSPNRRPVS